MANIPEIPGYRIEKELGQGGMARVFLAREEKLDRLVALKMMVVSPTQDNALAARFLKEARTAACLAHSNIVTIHDVGEHDGAYYMAMEYLPKGNLRDRILIGGLAPGEALNIVRQVASALQHAHEEGFIHRDIKPENILFRKNGTPVLADFGIAKATGSTTKLTKTGMSIGTPHYMSPEQARGQAVDYRSDLYSLGIVLFEMFTGKVPYDAEDSVAIAIKHIQEPVPVLTDSEGARRAVPSDLSRYQLLIDKLLAKSPADRVQDAAGLVRLIDELAQGQPSHLKAVEPEMPPPALLHPRQEPHFHHERPKAEMKLETPASWIPAGVSRGKEHDSGRKKIIWMLAGLLFVLIVVFILVIASGNQGASYRTLNKDEVKAMASRLGLFMSDRNPSAAGIEHQYQARTISGDRVVVDGTTGLMWHQSGSDDSLTFSAAQAWLADLNRRGYAGYSDWRLPTLEEGASLLESSQKNDDLYINSVFSVSQRNIWTGDSYSSGSSWVIHFNYGDVDWHFLLRNQYYVRPVRSEK